MFFLPSDYELRARPMPRLPAKMKAVALVACLPGPFYRWLCRLLLTDRR